MLVDSSEKIFLSILNKHSQSTQKSNGKKRQFGKNFKGKLRTKCSEKRRYLLSVKTDILDAK